MQNSAGAILSPFDSWLVMRGTKTLALRMEQHDKSGRAVAAFLEEHPKVRKGLLSGLGFAPAARVGKTTAARLRRHGCV